MHWEVSLVGPFASVEHKGQKISFIASGSDKEIVIVQPISDRYVLQPGQKAVYIAARGQVWVQPTDYPLPPEFNTAPVVATPSITPNRSDSFNFIGESLLVQFGPEFPLSPNPETYAALVAKAVESLPPEEQASVKRFLTQSR